MGWLCQRITSYCGGMFSDRNWWLSCLCLSTNRRKNARSAQHCSEVEEDNNEAVYTIPCNGDLLPLDDFTRPVNELELCETTPNRLQLHDTTLAHASCDTPNFSLVNELQSRDSTVTLAYELQVRDTTLANELHDTAAANELCDTTLANELCDTAANELCDTTLANELYEAAYANTLDLSVTSPVNEQGVHNTAYVDEADFISDGNKAELIEMIPADQLDKNTTVSRGVFGSNDVTSTQWSNIERHTQLTQCDAPLVDEWRLRDLASLNNSNISDISELHWPTHKLDECVINPVTAVNADPVIHLQSSSSLTGQQQSSVSPSFTTSIVLQDDCYFSSADIASDTMSCYTSLKISDISCSDESSSRLQSYQLRSEAGRQRNVEWTENLVKRDEGKDETIISKEVNESLPFEDRDSAKNGIIAAASCQKLYSPLDAVYKSANNYKTGFSNGDDDFSQDNSRSEFKRASSEKAINADILLSSDFSNCSNESYSDKSDDKRLPCIEMIAHPEILTQYAIPDVVENIESDVATDCVFPAEEYYIVDCVESFESNDDKFCDEIALQDSFRETALTTRNNQDSIVSLDNQPPRGLNCSMNMVTVSDCVGDTSLEPGYDIASVSKMAAKSNSTVMAVARELPTKSNVVHLTNQQQSASLDASKNELPSDIGQISVNRNGDNYYNLWQAQVPRVENGFINYQYLDVVDRKQFDAVIADEAKRLLSDAVQDILSVWSGRRNDSAHSCDSLSSHHSSNRSRSDDEEQGGANNSHGDSDRIVIHSAGDVSQIIDQQLSYLAEWDQLDTFDDDLDDFSQADGQLSHVQTYDDFFDSDQWLDDDFGFSASIKPAPMYREIPKSNLFTDARPLVTSTENCNVTEQLRLLQQQSLQQQEQQLQSYIPIEEDEILSIVSEALVVYWERRHCGETWNDVRPNQQYLGISSANELLPETATVPSENSISNFNVSEVVVGCSPGFVNGTSYTEDVNERKEEGKDEVVGGGIGRINGRADEAKSLLSYRLLVFDLVGEALQEIYSSKQSQVTSSSTAPWRKPEPAKLRRCISVDPPSTLDDLRPLVNCWIICAFRLHPNDRIAMRRRVQKSLCGARKPKDEIDHMLIYELGHEEPGWINYERDAITIKMRIVNGIVNSLVNDVTCALIDISSRKNERIGLLAQLLV